jgi:hypothetical protein
MEPATPKEELNKAVGEVQTYLEASKDYLKLQTFKMAMHLVSSLAKVLLVGLFALLELLFLSYSAALGLGVWMGSATYGFLTVGGIYVLIFIVSYLVRGRIDAPLLRHFSHLYFDES